MLDRLPELDPLEQLSLVADTLGAMLRGDLAAGRFLDVVRRLGEDTEPPVWDMAIAGLAEIDRAVSSDVRPELQEFVRDRVQPVVDHIGWAPEPGETDLHRRFRGTMLRVLGILGNDQVAIAEARRLFHDLLDGHHVLDGEVASAVLSIVAANGDRSDHVDLVHGYENAKSPQDEDRFRSALSWVPDRAAVDATMDMVLDGRIRSHDAGYTVARMVGVPETGAYAWEVLKQHWDEVLQRIPALTARSLLSQVHHRSEPEVAADIRAWLADHEVPGAHKYTDQQLERLDVRVRLRESAPTLD